LGRAFEFLLAPYIITASSLRRYFTRVSGGIVVTNPFDGSGVFHLAKGFYIFEFSAVIALPVTALK
jgi:hypothetical protein